MDDEQVRALLEDAIRPRNRAARRRALQILNHPRNDEERAIGQRLTELMTGDLELWTLTRPRFRRLMKRWWYR
jgi:hypothetical protein